MPLLRVNKQVLDSQKLIVGDNKVLLWDVASFTVLCSGALSVDAFRIWNKCEVLICSFLKHVWFMFSEYYTSHGVHTFFLDLALNIWMINDFTQSNAAEQWTQDAVSPAAAVGTIEDSHAEVTGEVGPLSKHRVLCIQKQKSDWTELYQSDTTRHLWFPPGLSSMYS